MMGRVRYLMYGVYASFISGDTYILQGKRLTLSMTVSLLTRSTRTVHTSAKARLTIVAKTRDTDPDRHQNLIIRSLADC